VQQKKQHSASTTHVPERTLLASTRLFTREFGSDLRYCDEQNKWYVWRGVRWEPDTDGHVERCAKQIPSMLAAKAFRTEDVERHKLLYKWAAQASSLYHIKGIQKLAETESKIPVPVAALDSDPLLLGVQNGVLDLKSGDLIQPEKSQLITKQAAVRYDRMAQCPRWRQFIDEVTNGDAGLGTYLQHCAGNFLTGLTTEQCIFFAYGSGANGKTVFFRILEMLLGGYAMTTPPETLMARRNTGGPSPDLARLRGARLVIASEPNQNCELEESVVKRLTGQDSVPCRHLYGELFQYVPTYKFVLITNHKPRIHGTDHAIWRRIRLVPFEVTIPEEKQDKGLIEKLRGELPGILNWAIEGALAYQKQGLKAPKCVVDATASYRSEMDVLGQWIDEECTSDTEAESPVGELHAAYCAWCRAGNYRAIKKRAFGEQLKARGYPRDRTGSTRFHRGIALQKNAQRIGANWQ
jgi:putative DNA primase/helicase